jgi:hypothetical protein
MIEAIRNEHNRIYMQDQQLLDTIKESQRRENIHSLSNSITVKSNNVDAQVEDFEDATHDRQSESPTRMILE